MSNLFDYNSLSQYVSGLLDRKLKAVSLAITSSTGYLRGLVDETKGYRDASGVSADAALTKSNQASADAAATNAKMRDFFATYLGVNAEDPATSSLGDGVKTSAFGIRSADGRLRYATRNGAGTLIWKDASVAADPVSLADTVVFLDKAAVQVIKGPVKFVGLVKVPTVIDWASESPPQAQDTEKRINDAIKAADIEKRIADALKILIPPKTIVAFNGTVAPNGWALCDGGNYVLLAGGPISTPDLRGRVLVGVSGDHDFGLPFGQTTATGVTGDSVTGVALNRTNQTTYAGGGTQTAVNSASLTDTPHHHDISIDVTQPSLALNYIMKL